MTDAEIAAIPEGPSWLRLCLLRAAAHDAEATSYGLHALAEMAAPYSTDEERKKSADKALELAALYRRLAASQREQAAKQRAHEEALGQEPAAVSP